jgi:hypothetical protein
LRETVLVAADGRLAGFGAGAGALGAAGVAGALACTWFTTG